MVHLTRILLFGFYIVFSMAFSQSNDWENPSYTGKGKEKPHTGFVLFYWDATFLISGWCLSGTSSP